MLRWRHLVNACEVKAHLIGCWQNLGAVCFWLPIPSGLNLVVVAVLRDSLCVVSLLPFPWQTVVCCSTMCKVEWFVLTVIKRRSLLLLYSFWCTPQIGLWGSKKCYAQSVPEFSLPLISKWWRHLWTYVHVEKFKLRLTLSNRNRLSEL